MVEHGSEQFDSSLLLRFRPVKALNFPLFIASSLP
jgi:hypothetical protein